MTALARSVVNIAKGVSGAIAGGVTLDGIFEGGVRVEAWAWRRLQEARSGVVRVLPAALPALLLAAPAWAISVDSHSQLHGVIGQPLSVDLPVSFAGINPGTVNVHVAPGPDLPDEEQQVAETVQAGYDAERSVVHLSTAQRVMVPTMRLHLTVSAGALVVNSDIDVLIDVPDLNEQHTARADGTAPRPEAAAADPGIRLLVIGGHDSARPAGDGAAGASTAGDDGRPTVTRPPPPPPPDTRPKTWQVHSGETLSGISRHLAQAYAVQPEQMSLALYEANRNAFAEKNPEQAIPGKVLQVPETDVAKSEPISRVTAFRAWLRQPIGKWLPRMFSSLQPAAEAPPAPASGFAPSWEFIRGIGTVTGALVVLLVLRQLLQRIRLRSLMTRYVPMSAKEVRKVTRMIIPAPPPRQGLSQGAVTEKLRIKRLREVLEQNPLRSDIRYRLAERLHKAGDGRTFAQIAPPLRPSLSPEGWARVCAMGRELLPDDPRFL
jgi:hypothetical protein